MWRSKFIDSVCRSPVSYRYFCGQLCAFCFEFLALNKDIGAELGYDIDSTPILTVIVRIHRQPLILIKLLTGHRTGGVT